MKKLSQSISLAYMGNLVYGTQRTGGSATILIKKEGKLKAYMTEILIRLNV